MGDFLYGLVVGIAMMLFIIAANSDNEEAFGKKCQANYTWRDMDYTYHCTAEKRP